MRANRVVVCKEDSGFMARFYKTHMVVGEVHSCDTDWVSDGEANATQIRESFRDYAIQYCSEIGVEWLPQKQAQAWDRKYQKYETDEQVGEDATALLSITLDEVMCKLGYNYEVEFVGVEASKSELTYVIDGKYEKNGCWAYANIDMAVRVYEDEHIKCEVPMNMSMVSGQIKKYKITQSGMMELIKVEEELCIA